MCVSVCVCVCVCVCHDRVKGFLDKLLWDRETLNEDIYRVKGVLNIKGKDEKHMLQVSSGHGYSAKDTNTHTHTHTHTEPETHT